MDRSIEEKLNILISATLELTKAVTMLVECVKQPHNNIMMNSAYMDKLIEHDNEVWNMIRSNYGATVNNDDNPMFSDSIWPWRSHKNE